MSPHLPIVRLLSPSPPCRSYTDTSPPSRAFGALPLRAESIGPVATLMFPARWLLRSARCPLSSCFVLCSFYALYFLCVFGVSLRPSVGHSYDWDPNTFCLQLVFESRHVCDPKVSPKTVLPLIPPPPSLPPSFLFPACFPTFSGCLFAPALSPVPFFYDLYFPPSSLSPSVACHCFRKSFPFLCLFEL